MDQLTLDCIAARKAGMSYGRWKALQPRVEVVMPKQEVKEYAPKRVCKYCGKEFEVTHNSMLYCDSACKYESNKAQFRAKYWMKKERMMADGKV